jgi:hypothetical protein
MEKKLLNTILQIDESEHLDKERMIIRYFINDNIESKIVNVEDLNPSQKQIYDDFIQMLENLI